MKNQKGFVLVIALMTTIIIVAIMLGVSVIMFNKIRLMDNIANSVPAFDAAHDGIEKVWHWMPGRTIEEACNLCSVCPTDASDPTGDKATHCNSCTTVPLDLGGCKVDFETTYASKKNTVSLTATCPYNITIFSTGSYNGVIRQTSVTRQDSNFDIQFCSIE